MSDVRSLEEVIADAYYIGSYGVAMQPEWRDHVAAAVREWCLAPQQIERAIRALAGITLCDPPCSTCMATARAALRAVMGDTP